MSDLLDTLRTEFEGKPYRGPRQGKDPVNAPMIRHLCEALGDDNPVYTDDEFAARTHFGGIVAPPTALQVWTMHGLNQPEDVHDRQPSLLSLLEANGYTSIVATNSEQEYFRYLRPGDEVTFRSSVESIVGPKQTALGEGYFVTTLETYSDQTGEAVGTNRFRMLMFNPTAAKAAAPAGSRPRPSINPDNAYFWEGIEAGELRIQRCLQCRRLRHPAQPVCRECGSLEWDWIVATGRGEVYSYVVHHHPPLPGFDLPLVVGLIALEEGVRTVGEVIINPDTAAVGLPVEVTFTRIDGDLTVPQWVPA